MLLSFASCHFTYFRIFSSPSPTVLTQYPFAQKWRPLYRFFNSRCLSKILIAHFPFRNPLISDTANFGGIDMTKCTWSSKTFISNISSFFRSHDCCRISSSGFFIAPRRILNRYFWHQTICYLHSQIACPNLLKLLIEYLLLSFESPTYILRRYYLFVTTKLPA